MGKKRLISEFVGEQYDKKFSQNPTVFTGYEKAN